MIELFSSFIQALIICAGIAALVVLLIALFGMINTKIECNNHYLKKELKDRNKIIANLLNSRNR